MPARPHVCCLRTSGGDSAAVPLGTKGDTGVMTRDWRCVYLSSRDYCTGFMSVRSEGGDVVMMAVFIVTGFYKRLCWFLISLLTREQNSFTIACQNYGK